MPSALEALHEYYDAFSTLNVEGIVAHFSEPCMTVGPQGVFTAGNRAVLADSLVPLIEGLRAKGYGRSKFIEPNVTILSRTAALVRGVAVRYTRTGSEMERIPLSYLMHQGEAGWKIAVLVAGS